MRAKLARAVGLRPSTSYYAHLMPAKDDALLQRIKASMKHNPAYGYERIAIDLHEGSERVRRLMRSNNLKPAIRRVKAWTKVPAVNLEQALHNLIQDKQAEQPSHIWVSDFTYIFFAGRWHYLATVLDLFSREVVGWQLGKRSRAQLIHLAYCDALSSHPPPRIFHADQGSQYTAASTRQLVELTGGQVSYSDKGSPWQNGYQESFYGHFKLELGDLTRFEHEGELFEAIAKQLYYYNHKRIHTALRTNPVEYRKNYETKRAANAARKARD